jgi:hypothetical protein
MFSIRRGLLNNFDFDGLLYVKVTDAENIFRFQ